MDPTIANALEELRQAGAYMPGTLPQSGFGFPALPTPAAAQPAASAPDIDAGNIPPPDMQMAVIEQIKSMLASPDPVQRQQAQAFVARYGRSFLGTMANTATG